MSAHKLPIALSQGQIYATSKPTPCSNGTSSKGGVNQTRGCNRSIRNLDKLARLRYGERIQHRRYQGQQIFQAIAVCNHDEKGYSDLAKILLIGQIAVNSDESCEVCLYDERE